MPDSPEPVIDVERLAVDLWGNEVLRPLWCRIASLEELSAALDVVSSDVVAISERERRGLHPPSPRGVAPAQAGGRIGPPRGGGGGGPPAHPPTPTTTPPPPPPHPPPPP